MSENSSRSVSCGASCQHNERVQRLNDASVLLYDNVQNVRRWGQFDKPTGDGHTLSGDQLWDGYLALRERVRGEMSDDSSLQYLHSQHAKEYRRKWGWPEFQPGVGVFRELSRLQPEHASELQHDLAKHQAIDSAFGHLNQTITICTSLMQKARLRADISYIIDLCRSIAEGSDDVAA